jgi:hypothetical protein
VPSVRQGIVSDHQPLVTANCPCCGPVEVAVGDVTLRVQDDTDAATLLTVCPCCGIRFSTPTTLGENLLLSTFGVQVEFSTAPTEIRERRANLAPITHDDLVRFEHQLSRTDTLVGLFRLEP